MLPLSVLHLVRSLVRSSEVLPLFLHLVRSSGVLPLFVSTSSEVFLCCKIVAENRKHLLARGIDRMEDCLLRCIMPTRC